MVWNEGPRWSIPPSLFPYRSAKEPWAAFLTFWASPLISKGRPKLPRPGPFTIPPAFEDQSIRAEMFETGMKVVDLIAPFSKGGKVGVFGGAGVGKTVIILELIYNVAK